MASYAPGRHLSTLCMFYEQGWCKAGDQCRFTHGKSDRRELIGSGAEGPSGAAASIPEECKFFAKGRCSRGQSCPYLHSRYSVDEDLRRRTQTMPSSLKRSNPPPPRRAAPSQTDPSDTSSPPRVASSTPAPATSSSPWSSASPCSQSFYVRDRMWTSDKDDGEVARNRDESRASEAAGRGHDRIGADGVYPPEEDEGVYFYGAPGGFDEYSDAGHRAAANGLAGASNPPSWRHVVSGGSPVSTPGIERDESRPSASCVTTANPVNRGASASRSSEMLRASSMPTCTYYLRGMCRFGESCRYSHQAEPWVCEEEKGDPGGDFEEAEVDEHGLEGDWRWVGYDECFNEEGEDGKEDEACLRIKEPEKNAVAREASLDEEERVQSRDAECGVCLDKVKERFGILVGCKHVYCLSCIREWRNKSNNRECPQCRVTSHFVVPSVKLVTDPERKERLVAEYKKVLAVIPCQHFDFGESECPFGSSCFYSHTTRDGTPVDMSRPRVRLTESGESEPVRDVYLSSFLEERSI